MIAKEYQPSKNFSSVFIGKTRWKIQVQPTAVSRRKSKIGSREKQSNVKTKNLPSRHVSFKRKRNIAGIIDQNVLSAKKAVRSMISNTKYFKKNLKNAESMSITYYFAYSDTFLNDFFSKCEQIREYLKICSHLLKKFLMENITFCVVYKVNMWKLW